MLIVIVSARATDHGAFIRALDRAGAEVAVAPSGRECLKLAASRPPALVVVDQDLPDLTCRELLTDLLQVNAMVNTAVLSPLSAEDFHEWGEGLGILCALPLSPSEGDAATLLEKLRGLGL